MSKVQPVGLLPLPKVSGFILALWAAAGNVGMSSQTSTLKFDVFKFVEYGTDIYALLVLVK